MLRSAGAIFVLVFAVVAVFVGIASRIAVAAVEQTLTSRLQHELEHAARVAESIIRQRQPTGDWDALADELGEQFDARVTLIAADGTVLGDSAIARENLPRLENHGDRPEVSVARTGETGFAMRDSTSVSERLAYAALPYGSQPAAASQPAGKSLSVVRLARQANEIGHAKNQVEVAFVGAGVIALLLVGFAIWATNRQRDERVATLRSAMKHSPDKLRSFFQDESPEQKLARAIDDSQEHTRVELEALREQVQRQRQILEGMQEGVLVLDEDANVAFVNRALREMLLLGQEAAGRPLLEVVRNAELSTLVERTRQEGAPQTGELETTGLKPRMLLVQTSPLDVSIAPGATAHGTRSLVAVFVDVTDVRRLESLRRDFVANVSHELRTPVTAIKSATETLRTSALHKPNDALTFLDIVDRNAQRLADLVEDLLDLSRIESKAYKLSLEPLSLQTVAAYCLSLFKERAEKKRLRLDNAIAADLAPVRADRRALEQVLTNLIDNAVKYCPEGSEIVIGAQVHGEALRIIVKDTGPGIEAKHLPRLFERFYRVDPGRARDTGGTGLGLSIAKHLVEAMEGSIGVDSKPGAGTTFFVTLGKA